MSKRSVRESLKGWPAAAALFLSTLDSLFFSQASYFSFIFRFRVLNSVNSIPEKFLKCAGFLIICYNLAFKQPKRQVLRLFANKTFVSALKR
jgi:hypothetical protein